MARKNQSIAPRILVRAESHFKSVVGTFLQTVMTASVRNQPSGGVLNVSPMFFARFLWSHWGRVWDPLSLIG